MLVFVCMKLRLISHARVAFCLRFDCGTLERKTVLLELEKGRPCSCNQYLTYSARFINNS